jgi:biopolymer transport protein ExbD
MRIPSRDRNVGLKFNVTPLIDVVFLLIIFFLAASHFVRHDDAEPVELPEATQEQEEDPRKLPLVVTVRRDRTLLVRGEAVDHGRLDQMILAGRLEQGERFEVHLRTDKTVPYRVIEPILMSCARAHANFKFAVLPR